MQEVISWILENQIASECNYHFYHHLWQHLEEIMENRNLLGGTTTCNTWCTKDRLEEKQRFRRSSDCSLTNRFFWSIGFPCPWSSCCPGKMGFQPTWGRLFSGIVSVGILFHELWIFFLTHRSQKTAYLSRVFKNLSVASFIIKTKKDPVDNIVWLLYKNSAQDRSLPSHIDGRIESDKDSCPTPGLLVLPACLYRLFILGDK